MHPQPSAPYTGQAITYQPNFTASAPVPTVGGVFNKKYLQPTALRQGYDNIQGTQPKGGTGFSSTDMPTPALSLHGKRRKGEHNVEGPRRLKSARFGEQSDVESEADDDSTDGFALNSVAEAKNHEFARASLSKEISDGDDWKSIKRSKRLQKECVTKLLAAMTAGYQKQPIHGERFGVDERNQEWKRYQKVHVSKVQDVLGKRGGSAKAEKAAWLLLGALFDGHRCGLLKSTLSPDRKLKFTDRFELCITVMQDLPIVALDVLKGKDIPELVGNPSATMSRMLTNLWVNFQKKLDKQGRKEAEAAEMGEMGEDGEHDAQIDGWEDGEDDQCECENGNEDM